MSVTPTGRLLSIGGFVEYCYSNGYRFTDSTSNDLMFYTDYKDQNIVLGTHHGALSALRITSNEVQINYNAYVGKSLSIGTSNVRNYLPPHRFVLEGESNSTLGAHWAAYVKGDTLYPMFQQYNNNHDDVNLTFDAYYTGSNWQSSAQNNFQMKKFDGKLMFNSACNMSAGCSIDWYAALTINSNSFIGIGTSNPTHKLTTSSTSNTILGPHAAFYIDEDPYHPMLQQLHWNHDQITHSYDAYWDSNNWISSSSNGNFQIQKQDGKFMIQSACNTIPGAILDNDWRNAFTVNSNSYIGIGTSNTTHRLTMRAEDSSQFGPHIAYYTNTEFPLFQQLNLTHDQISQTYDGYFESNNWYSSSTTGSFQMQKLNGHFLFNTACNFNPGELITDWRTSMAINSNSFLVIGDSNPSTSRITVRAEDSSPFGPHIAYYTDSNYPLYQQLNWTHDQISQSYDAYFESNNWVSSSTKGNFQLQKLDGHFIFHTACNFNPGELITDWRTAFTINSNSYIGIGTSNTSHRLTINAEDSTVLGPHVAFYTSTDSNHALYQQLNWTHDQITHSFDAYWNSNNWISSSSNGIFQMQKQNGRLMFMSACNLLPGEIADDHWRTALTVNSNSYIGIGTSNTTHRLTISAEDSTILGPHVAFYTSADSNHALYQQLNWTHDHIAQTYDAYWDSNNWISSSSNGIFQMQKHDGRLMFMSACNLMPGEIVDDHWRTALTVNSNSYIGIGTSNTTHRLTINAEDSTVFGPHVAFYTSADSNHALYQQLNWTHDQITHSFDAYWDSNNWISSSSNGIFQMQKQNGRLMFMSACNLLPGEIADEHWRTALTVNSNSYIGIGTSNPTQRLTFIAENSSLMGPHTIVYTDSDSNNPLFHQLNWNTDDIHMAFDSHFDGSNWISSASNGVFKISKNLGSLSFNTSCNISPGSNIEDWTQALTINSNSFIGIKTSDPTHRLTIRGEDSNMLGPHVAYYSSSDSNNPIFQQLNWSKDNVATTYNAYYDGSNWISSGPTANIRVQFEESRLTYYTSCNIETGCNIDSNWYNAYTVNSNSYIGIGTPNPINRLTLSGPINDHFGPHMAFSFLDDQTNPSFQIYNSNLDNISLNFSSFWDGSNFISSSSNTNFQIKKQDNTLLFQSVPFAYVSSNIDDAWKVGLSISSNAYVGINHSNPEYPFDVDGQSMFRSNINITGHILPNSNMTMDLGSMNNRFKDLWLSGESLDMEGLKLQKEYYSGGLTVYDWVMDQPARICVKEILVGNASDLLNSNVFLITASSNGLKFNNVTSNLPPQNYSQLNNMFVTQTNVGIGINNPEKSLQVRGDVEINPNEIFSFFWDNLIFRMEQHDVLNAINNSMLTSWVSFESINKPTYFKTGGYNNSPYIQCQYEDSYFINQNTLDINAGDNNGFTAFVLARFNRDSQSNETLFSFSNNNYVFEFGRDENTKELKFSTNESVLITSNNAIMQNQWSLYSVRHDATSNILNIYKNGSNVADMVLPYTSNMSFLPSITLGNANVDLSSFYLFDRPLFNDELANLTRKILYPGHKSFLIRTNGQQYPPEEFYNDTFGWNTNGKRNGGQVYQKKVENVFYGNGIYKIWANTESDSSYLAFDFNLSTAWLSSEQIYNSYEVAKPPPTLYIEYPFPLRTFAYTITSTIIPTQTPSSWTLYGSMNGSTWITLDSKTGETTWLENEERVYYIYNADACKIFKLEILNNDSYPAEFVGIAKFVIYGDEHAFSIDGTGIGINTPYPKEALTIDGEGYISKRLTIGHFDDTLKKMTYEWPHLALAGYSNIVDNKSYIVEESSIYALSYEGYRAFTKVTTDLWAAESGTYDATGACISNKVTIVDNTPVVGEWLQIKLPNSIKLTSYKISPRLGDANITAPYQFRIVGSVDGITWQHVDFVYAYLWDAYELSKTFYVSGDLPPFSYYRLIIIKIGSSINPSTVVITDISYYGDVYEIGNTNGLGKVLVRGKLKATEQISVCSETIECLLKCSIDEIRAKHSNGSVCQTWGSFSSVQYPLYIDESLLIPHSSFMDAGKTTFKLSQGFTFIVLAKFHNNSDKTTLFCGCDTDTTDNQIFFGKTDTSQTLTFSINNNSITCFTLSTPIEEETYHVYSVRLTDSRAEIYIDNKLEVYQDLTIIPIDRVVEHVYINKDATDYVISSSLNISDVKIWNTSLEDSLLFQEIETSRYHANLYVKGITKIDVIKSSLEIQSKNTYSTANYIFPPSALTNDITHLDHHAYGNGTYKVSASYSTAYHLFDNVASTYWQSDNMGSSLTTLANGMFFYGEWVQIDLPVSIVMTYYTFMPTDTMIAEPTAWTLVGSDDGMRWFTVGSSPQLNPTWVEGEMVSINISSNKAYKYWRWVFTESNSQTVALKQIQIYGQVSTVLSVNNSDMVVFSKLGINTTEPAAALHVAGFSVLSGLKIVAGNASNITVPTNPGGGSIVNSQSNVTIIGYSNEPTGISLSIPGNNSTYAFRFITGSASNEVVRLNGLGNVGINTENPTEKLHVNGNMKINSNMYVGNSLGIGRSNPDAGLHVSTNAIFDCNVTFIDKIDCIKADPEWDTWSFNVQHNDVKTSFATGGGKGIKINTGSQSAVLSEPYISDFYNVAALECMNDDYGSLLYVRNDGKIGIGTSNAEETLSVVGTISLSNHGKAILYTSNNNLGINTETPSKTLDISGDLNYTGNLYQNGVMVPSSPWFQYQDAIFYMSNIGIGTSNVVEEALLVCSNIAISNFGKVVMWTSNSGLGINTSDVTETLTIGGNSLSLSNYGKTVLYTSNNYLGIGISEPDTAVDVLGDINITGAFYQNHVPIVSTQWTTNNTDIYYVDNVGIGTPNPLSKLHVEGDIIVGGHILPTSNIMYDLGSSANSFKDLYLSGNSIYLSNIKMTSTFVDGALKISDANTGALQRIIVNELQLGSVDNPLDSNIYVLKLVNGQLNLMNITNSESNATPASMISGIYALPNAIGIHNANPTFALDVTGDINMTGKLYQNGTAFQTSRWNSNADGIYIRSNVGINGNNNPDYGLMLTGAMALSNVNGMARIYTEANRIGINTQTITDSLTIAGDSISLNNGISRMFLQANSNCLGLNTSNALYTWDVEGDINFTGGLYQNGDHFQGSRWSCNESGIFIGSNVGINIDPASNVGLLVNGSIGLCNNTGLTILYPESSNIGINTSNPQFTLDVNGDINMTGSLYQNGSTFITSQWTSLQEGIYVPSNAAVNTIPDLSNAFKVVGNTYLQGDVNFTGNFYNNGVMFETNKWASNEHGIHTMSNVSIGAPLVSSSNILSVTGNISLDRGLLLRGIQISKNPGGMNNVTQQVMNIPGVSNTSNNVVFYNGLYMKGLRLSAGDPTIAPASVTFATSNMQGFKAINNNVQLSIPSSNYVNRFQFLTGSDSNEVVSITGDGRVGINTSNPQAHLHINGSAIISGQSLSVSNSANPFILIQANSTGTALQGVAKSATVFSTDAQAGDYIIKSFTGGKVILQSSNAGSAVCINTNNYVGIRNPNALFPLDVIGDINLSGTLRQGGLPYVGSQWFNVSSNVFITNSNVCIGGVSAVERLQVVGKSYSTIQSLVDSNTTSNLPGFSFLQNSNTGMYLVSNNVIGFSTNGIERLRISSNNIGINTSNPIYSLDVNGTIRLNNSGTVNNKLLVLYDSDPNQNITTSAHFYGFGVNDHILRYQVPTGENHKFYESSNERFTIRGDGNVGVGNSNPSYNLDVNTTMRAGTSIISGGITSGTTSTLTCSNLIGNLGTFTVASENSLTLQSDWNNNNSGAAINFQCGPTTIAVVEPNCIRPNTDNGATLGLLGNRFTSVYSVNGTIQTSDSQDKDYVALEYGLSNLMKIETIKYKWNNLAEDDPEKGYEYYGVLADQVDQIFPELVYNQVRPYQLNYNELIPVCINAIKELNEKQQTLKGYMDLPPPFESTQVFNDFTVVGIDRLGRLTNRFSEALSFCILTEKNRVAYAGRLHLNLVIQNANPGDYIIPMLGPKDSIEVYAINDFRVSFNEYKMAIGLVQYIEDNRPIIMIKCG